MGVFVAGPGPSRLEILLYGVLLFGVAGFGIHRLGEVLQGTRGQDREKDVRVVACGETLPLTYREVGRRECNQIPWTGIVELVLRRAVVYSSFFEAGDAEPNASNPNRMLRDKSAPFLLIDVEVKNVDAEEGGYWWQETFAERERAGVSNSDGAITLEYSFLLETPVGSLHSSLWCIDGEPLPENDDMVTIPQGKAACVTLGFSLEHGVEECLDESYLTYLSPFDRMEIG